MRRMLNYGKNLFRGVSQKVVAERLIVAVLLLSGLLKADEVLSYNWYEWHYQIREIETPYGETYRVAKIKQCLPGGGQDLKSRLFGNSENYRYVELPNFPGIQQVEIGEGAFRDCESLRAVALNGNEIVGIEREAFAGCSNFLGFFRYWRPESNNTVSSQEADSLDVVAVGDRAFDGCAMLSKCFLGYSVTTIGEYAFRGCINMACLHVSRNLNSIGIGAFERCAGLHEIVCDAGNQSFTCTDGCLYTNDGDLVAAACSGGSLVIPNGVRRIACDFLGSDKDNLYRYDYNYDLYDQGLAKKLGGISRLQLPASLTEISPDAFSAMCNLHEIEVASGNGHFKVERGCLVSMDGHRLYAATINNGKVTFADSVTEMPEAYMAFSDQIEELELPAGLENIPSSCFFKCDNLFSIRFGSGLRSIGYDAFRSCKALVDYQLPGNVSVLSNAFRDSGIFHVQLKSTKMRANDPTVMDIVYRVVSKSGGKVRTRILAYKNGERNLNNVIRPETFIEGTGSKVGDLVDANVEHVVSWRVSSDWRETLANVNVEVMADQGNRFSWRYMILPEEGGGRLKIYTDTMNALEAYDALLWLYASGDSDLTLTNGNLYGSGELLASGKYLRIARTGYDAGNVTRYEHDDKVLRFLLPKFGYQIAQTSDLGLYGRLTRKSLAAENSCYVEYNSFGGGEFTGTRAYLKAIYAVEHLNQ